MNLVSAMKTLGTVASPNGKTCHFYGLFCQTECKSDNDT